MSNSQSLSVVTLELSELSFVVGGAAPPADSQAQLRSLAAQYCPATYEKFKTAPTITRRMGERCLDEAGYGSWKSSLDKYFPKK